MFSNLKLDSQAHTLSVPLTSARATRALADTHRYSPKSTSRSSGGRAAQMDDKILARRFLRASRVRSRLEEGFGGGSGSSRGSNSTSSGGF